MSTIEKFSILDPRVNVSETFRRWYGFLGAKEVECLQTPASSGSNNSTTNFDIKFADNSNVIADRSSIILAVDVTITKTGPGTGGNDNIYQAGVEGFRCRPLEKIMNTLKVKVCSGQTIDYQPWQYTTALEKFISNPRNKQQTPTMVDRTQTYAGSFGRNMSPFANRLDNPYEVTRGAYPITVVSNTPTSAVITSRLYLNMGDYPPFTTDENVIGINVQPFMINISWLGMLSRIWSIDTTNHTQPFSNISVTLSNPNLSMLILTLPFGMNIPQQINYPHHEVVYVSKTTNGAIASGASFNFNSEVFQFDVVPAKIYVLAKPSDSTATSSILNAVSSTDTFAQMSNLSMTFGTKTSYFNNYDPINLFDVTKTNGLNQDIAWVDWNGLNGSGTASTLTGPVPLMGSIFCCDPVKDMGSALSPLTTGLGGKWNFKVQADFVNISPNATEFDMCFIAIYDGLLTIDGHNHASANNTVITDIREMQPSDIPFSQIASMHGGSFSSFFKGIWSKLRPFLGVINEALKKTGIISKVVGMTPFAPIAPHIARMGYGEGEGEGEGEGVGEGGAVVSRTQLSRAMKRYR